MVSRPPRMRIARAVAVLSAVITVAAAITVSNERATADPAEAGAPDGSHISDIHRRDDRILDIGVSRRPCAM